MVWAFCWVTLAVRNSCSSSLRPPLPPAGRVVNTMPLSVSVEAGIPCAVTVLRSSASTIAQGRDRSGTGADDRAETETK